MRWQGNTAKTFVCQVFPSAIVIPCVWRGENIRFHRSAQPCGKVGDMRYSNKRSEAALRFSIFVSSDRPVNMKFEGDPNTEQ